MANLADACYLLGERPRAQALYDELVPFGWALATAPHLSLGSISRNVGQLATLLERWEDTRRHYEEALDQHRR